jgi:hypothetical protein
MYTVQSSNIATFIRTSLDGKMKNQINHAFGDRRGHSSIPDIRIFEELAKIL